MTNQFEWIAKSKVVFPVRFFGQSATRHLIAEFFISVDVRSRSSALNASRVFSYKGLASTRPEISRMLLCQARIAQT